MYATLKAALIVSFPSRDKEWLFTTANTPVSEEDNSCEALSGQKFLYITHLILKE